MATPAHWFPREEYAAHLACVQATFIEGGQNALLAFRQETVTYLTGCFTRGHSSFQFAIVPASGDLVLICHDVEEYYLDSTCVFSRRFLWSDSEVPVAVGAEAIRQAIGPRARPVELAAWPLNAARHKALTESLPEMIWSDADSLVARMRLVKSPAEIAYQRRAAAAVEAGMSAALASAREGATEREMAAEICAAMIRAGSDLPGPGVLSSGERAFHLHGGYSDRVLQAGDIVQMEVTPNVRHYHARFMLPAKVAHATDEDHRVVEQLIAIQDAALKEVAPGVPATVPDAIYGEGVLSAGLRSTYTNKTFYSVGLMLAPNGGEPLVAALGASWRFEPGMTFRTYFLARGFGMSETITITHTDYERLTRFPRQLFVT